MKQRKFIIYKEKIATAQKLLDPVRNSLRQPGSPMKKLLAAAALATVAISAQAAPVYVGSFQVDQGDGWWNNPQVRSASEAAALIFGGVAADYDISTVGSDVAQINNMGWYSIWGIAGGTLFAEDYSFSSCGAGGRREDQPRWVRRVVAAAASRPSATMARVPGTGTWPLSMRKT
jgi:hypothetical protein